MRLISLLVSAFLVLANAQALAFDVALEQGLTLVVPALPAITVEKQATPATASLALAGSDGTYSIYIVVAPAQAGASPRICAGSALRSLVSQAGMPDRDSIYRAPLDERTFLVLYILGSPPNRQFRAHLLSSSGASHCVEARFTKPLVGQEDEDNWRKAFADARFVERTK